MCALKSRPRGKEDKALSLAAVTSGTAVILFFLMPYKPLGSPVSPHIFFVVLSVLFVCFSWKDRYLLPSSIIITIVAFSLLLSSVFAPYAPLADLWRAWLLSLAVFWATANTAHEYDYKVVDIVVLTITSLWSCAAIAQAHLGADAFVSAWFGMPPSVVYSTGLAAFSNQASALLVPLLVWILLQNITRPTWYRSLLWAAGCLSLYYTMSRAGILALITALGVVAIVLSVKMRHKELYRLFTMLMLALGVAACGWLLPTKLDYYEPNGSNSAGRWLFGKDEFYDDSSGNTVGDYSARTRLLAMQVGLKAIREAPWTGIGMGRFPSYYSAHSDDYKAEAIVDPRKEMTAHNGYLQMAAESGLPSLVVFLAVLGFIVYRLATIDNPSATTVLASIIGMSVWLLFHDGLFDRGLWILLGLGLASIPCHKVSEKSAPGTDETRRKCFMIYGA